MNLKEVVYSVLLVSSSEKFNNAVSELLPLSKYSPVQIAKSISSAKRLVAERSYDFIIINSPLPDDVGIRFATDTCKSGGSVVLLLTRPDVYDEIYDRVTGCGVFSLTKPISKPTVLTALCFMSAARERLRDTEKKSLSVEEKMEEIRFVNRAKWLLISELKMDESEAHRYIEKQAMDRCIAKRKVAEEIIKTYM